MINNKFGSDEPPLSYPKSIAFIISNEFCERFNYYGLRTVLVLYMTIKLGYSDDDATVLFHVFTSLVYFFSIFGAIIADSFLGKFKTILYLSCVYAVGSVMITVGAIPIFNLPAKTFTIIGLLLFGLGSGGIKPCVSAFGGDQFKIPEQVMQLAKFFSFFYFSINAGSLIATWAMPLLREDVHCFGDLSCFSLAFGVPGVLMVISIIVFVAGRSLYVNKQPEGNVIVKVSRCVLNAISERSKQSQRKLSHWMDYAEPQFGKEMVDDVKSVLKILLMFVPLPLFWALFDQQGSRWTFQATRMTGNIGFTEIKPDQMQVINPLLILVFIPIFDCSIYPFLAKLGFKRPLQKLATGGILAGIAFLISGIVELQLEKTYPVFPEPNESQTRIYNAVKCNYTFSTPSLGVLNLDSLGMQKISIKTESNISKTFSFLTTSPGCSNVEQTFNIQPNHANSFFISGDSQSPAVQTFSEKVDKTRSGYPAIRLLSSAANVKLIRFMNSQGEISVEVPSSAIGQFEILPDRYTIFADELKLMSSAELLLGGVYTITIGNTTNGNIEMHIHTITPPNSVHMLWLIPQFVVMTAGEVMFSVTGLEFAYSQSPSSMKSLLQACWLLTVGFGNVIVVVIAEAKFFQSQANEFFLFAILMFIDMGVFGLFARNYVYVTKKLETKDDADIENAIPIDDKKKVFSNNAFQED